MLTAASVPLRERVWQQGPGYRPRLRFGMTCPAPVCKSRCDSLALANYFKNGYRSGKVPYSQTAGILTTAV